MTRVSKHIPINENKIREIHYRALFNTIRDGIIIFNDKGVLLEHNPFVETILGYSIKNCLGKKLWECKSFKNNQTVKNAFRRIKKRGYSRYERIFLQTGYGTTIETEFVGSTYQVNTSRILYFIIRDISERQRMEVSLELERLHKQEEATKDFIADVTHELRTPLAIIKGNVDLGLHKQEDPLRVAQTFRAINTEIHHITSLLSDLKLLTEKDKEFEKKITLREVYAPDLIRQAIKRCLPLASKSNIAIHIREPFPKITILGDRAYLERLFINITKNAIMYGKQGGAITMTGTKENGALRVEVHDDGIGIPEDELPHIFSRFYRSKAVRESTREGSGLGLAISEWIVRAHNGTIHATSKEGKGTTITITLPIKPLLKKEMKDSP